MTLNSLTMPKSAIFGHTIIGRASLDMSNDQLDIKSICLEFFNKKRQLQATIYDTAGKDWDFSALSFNVDTNAIGANYMWEVIYYRLKIITKDNQVFIFPETDYRSFNLYAEAE